MNKKLYVYIGLPDGTKLLLRPLSELNAKTELGFGNLSKLKPLPFS